MEVAGEPAGELDGGASFSHLSGGVGHPDFPGTVEHTATLGRYWTHTYARRIVPAPDESHVWLLTDHATFREWSSPDPTTGVYQTVSPSNEYRTLTWLGAGVGWELTGLGGTVHTFGDDGRWISTTDRNGDATAATYDASGFLVLPAA